MKSSLKFSIRVFSKFNDIINILILVKSLPKPLCPPVQCFAVFLLKNPQNTQGFCSASLNNKTCFKTNKRTKKPVLFVLKPSL